MLPLGQAVHGVHDAALVVVVNPLAQVVHTRSDEVVPAVVTEVPAAQVDQFAHASAFEVVVKAPLAHGAHVRFAVVEPAALW